MAVIKHNSKKPSLSQVSKLADQLTIKEQAELCYKLESRTKRITVVGPLPYPKNAKLDKIRRSAQEALKRAGVTVNDLQAEAIKVREQSAKHKNHSDLANAS